MTRKSPRKPLRVPPRGQAERKRTIIDTPVSPNYEAIRNAFVSTVYNRRLRCCRQCGAVVRNSDRNMWDHIREKHEGAPWIEDPQG
jgi:hypothetical protein